MADTPERLNHMQESFTARQAKGPGILHQVGLVWETAVEVGALLNDLPRWLKPEQTVLTIVTATAELDEPDWMLREPDDYLKVVMNRQAEVETLREQLKAALEHDRFRVQNEHVVATSDAACTQTVGELAGLDLLIVAAALQRERRAKTSSFAACLMAHAPGSVLLYRKTLPRPRLRVLLATDGSEAANRAARRLPELLNPENLSVDVVTVSNPVYLENAILGPYVNTAAIDQALDENAAMVLQITRELLEAGGVPVNSTKHLWGGVAANLLNQIEQLQPDLIVVGPHNHHHLPPWLLGSVSHRLLHAVSHNLLIVR